MTRIVGGRAGGRRLSVPPGRSTRPTPERAREALFSALEARHGTLAGRRFLDLYAGSGAIGLEAASRGAVAVVLVERDPLAITTLRANATALGLTAVEVRGEPVDRFLTQPPATPYDVCFLDPPYADPVDRDLAVLAGADWLAPTGTVVVERATRSGAVIWPDGLVEHRSRRYGESTLWYGRRP